MSYMYVCVFCVQSIILEENISNIFKAQKPEDTEHLIKLPAVTNICDGSFHAGVFANKTSSRW